MKKIVAIVCLGFTLLLSSCIKLRVYEVSFDTMGGTQIDPIEVKATGFVGNIPETTKDGFVFDGWFFEEVYTTPFNKETYSIVSNIKLYAKWSYDIISNTSYELKNNILSWVSEGNAFEVILGDEQFEVDTPEFNLEDKVLKLKDVTYIQVYEHTTEGKKFLFSSKFQARNLNIVYQGNFRSWEDMFKGEGVEVKSVHTKDELWLVIPNPQTDVAFLETKEKDFYSRIDLSVYSQHAVHNIRVGYSVDKINYTYLEMTELSHNTATVNYEIAHDVAVYIRIELVKDIRNQTSNRYIALQNLILYGTDQGYEINEIREGNK